MKNWVLYFFAILISTVSLLLVAEFNPLVQKEAVILVEGEEMDLESYTLKAMRSQTTKEQSEETKKALAVAIRSQAYYLSAYGLNHKDFDVCLDENCCFGLTEPKSVDEALLEQCKNAVAQTQGLVLLYNGEPAMPLFCICSGSGTSDCERFIYLKGVAEAERCDIHKTQKEIPLEEFGFSLSESDCCFVYDKWNKCDFAVREGEYITGEEFQNIFGLKSTEIVVEYNSEYVTAISYGAGKGFGMSLCGAEKMGKDGSGYEMILKKYYPELELIYNN